VRLARGVGVTRGFPSAGQPRPHAPTAVGAQSYGYDANGNLTSAEGRSYAYDADNRLWQLSQSGAQLKAFGYGADGELRTRTDGATLSRRYVTPDYHLELPSGQAVAHYRFGGRTVAYAGASYVAEYWSGWQSALAAETKAGGTREMAHDIHPMEVDANRRAGLPDGRIRGVE
jgi:uncharacterized protein RhaS with RHS repeats